jgi:hypothetical protein
VTNHDINTCPLCSETFVRPHDPETCGGCLDPRAQCVTIVLECGTVYPFDQGLLDRLKRRVENAGL